MIRSLHNEVAVGEHTVQVALLGKISGTEISLIIRADRAERFPALLRVHQDRVVLGSVKIENRLQHLIFDLDDLQSAVNRFLRSAGHNCHRIADKTHMAVENQAVIGAGLRIRLSGEREALLRNILPGIDRFNARYAHGGVGADLLNHGIGMGTAQKLYDQAVRGSQVIHKDRLTGHQRHGVLLHYGLIHILHTEVSPFDFL